MITNLTNKTQQVKPLNSNNQITEQLKEQFITNSIQIQQT